METCTSGGKEVSLVNVFGESVLQLIQILSYGDLSLVCLFHLNCFVLFVFLNASLK